MPRFDLEQFLQIMQDHKITRAYLVPPIVLALAKHPLVDKFDLSSLELILSGAAPLGQELQQTVEKRLGCRALQGYGLTETSPVTHVIPDDDTSEKAGSIGPLVPSTEAKVVDVDNGTELEANQRGEIWVRGPQIMKGYLNNEEATSHTIDADGFLHTGDIGYADDDGYFYIVDRLKELIKYKGFQVPPAELEALLLGHESIGDAAVIPVPDEEAGEIPKAYIVKSGDVGEEDVISWVAERVAAHKKIRRVEFVDEIPKSAPGKILRRVLVERARGEQVTRRRGCTRGVACRQGRLAQRESTRFTPEGSAVRSRHRPPAGLATPEPSPCRGCATPGPGFPQSQWSCDVASAIL